MPDNDAVGESQFMNAIKSSGSDNDSVELATALSELLKELSSEEKDVLFSELTEREIKHISVLETVDDPLMDRFVKNFRNNKVSKRRRGRKELVNVADSLSDLIATEQAGGIKDKITDIIS